MPILRKTLCHIGKAVLFGGQVLQPRADYVRSVFANAATMAGEALPSVPGSGHLNCTKTEK